MSEVWRALQKSYREVDKLFADLQQPVFARQDWKGSVYARRSLGNHVQVEISYLAEHFLLAWNDWWGLCERYLRYFGQPDEKLPRTWRTLESRCRSLADSIVRDSLLDQIVSHNWMVPTALARLIGEDEDSPRSLFHALVMSHRRLTLVMVLKSHSERYEDAVSKPMPEGPVLPETSDIARRLNQGLIHQWDELSSTLREDTLWYLRNYQRSNLAVSWLVEETNRSKDHTRSAFLHALTSEKHVPPSIELFVQQLTIEAGEKQTVSRMLRRLESAVAEIDYDNFVEDLSSGEFLGGNDTPVGTDSVNLIPGRGKTACCTTLLAVSQGDKKAIGFPSIMKQVREHLIRCINTTRVVIVICDYWQPDMLDDHIGDLRAHHDRGVRFLFLMVGTPGRVVAPVAVDLGMIG
jgi:hypothetical protein